MKLFTKNCRLFSGHGVQIARMASTFTLHFVSAFSAHVDEFDNWAEDCLDVSSGCAKTTSVQTPCLQLSVWLRSELFISVFSTLVDALALL